MKTWQLYEVKYQLTEFVESAKKAPQIMAQNVEKSDIVSFFREFPLYGFLGSRI